jgi:hypothetical protein
MNHGILKFSADVLALERKGKWKSAAELAYRQWTIEPQNINLLCCAGTELWHTLLEMEYTFASSKIGGQELDDTRMLQTLLWEVASYGERHFAKNANFNAYFGYMYNVMPYYFNGYNGDYIRWQKRGQTMMCRAYELDPGNLFAVAMAYSNGESGDFASACKDFWSKVTPTLWGTGMVARYFFHILNGTLFYPDTFIYD